MELPRKESAYNAGDQVQSLGQEDPLEEGMATHPSILAWRIPWIEEPGRLQSMGWQRAGHDWAPFISLHMGLIPYFYWSSLVEAMISCPK